MAPILQKGDEQQHVNFTGKTGRWLHLRKTNSLGGKEKKKRISKL